MHGGRWRVPSFTEEWKQGEPVLGRFLTWEPDMQPVQARKTSTWIKKETLARLHGCLVLVPYLTCRTCNKGWYAHRHTYTVYVHMEMELKPLPWYQTRCVIVAWHPACTQTHTQCLPPMFPSTFKNTPRIYFGVRCCDRLADIMMAGGGGGWRCELRVESRDHLPYLPSAAVIKKKKIQEIGGSD